LAKFHAMIVGSSLYRRFVIEFVLYAK
jgi:hypothetical protein